LTTAIGSRQLLLVLDNCEHVLESAAHIVETIVKSCPGVSVLATSRERLGVADEHLWPVAPLETPPGESALEGVRHAPAVQLFVERARAALPDFDVTADNAIHITGLCNALDGLPLALELAAARLSALTLEDITIGLGRRLDFLSHAQRGAEPRHRTLRHVVNWSYDLLDEPERRLFERLSVFAGGFTLEQVEAVCPDDHVSPERTIDLLASLVEKSMVVHAEMAPSGRYRMLETLRRYAHVRLKERGEHGTFKRAHARYMLEFAEAGSVEISGADEAAWFPRIDAEIDNLRIAHGWALDSKDVDVALRMSRALHRFAFWRLRYEILEWASLAAERAKQQSSPLLPSVIASAGVAAWARGDLIEAKRLGERALAAAEIGVPERGLPFELLGDVALYEGRHQDADRMYADAVTSYREAGDVQSEVFGLASQAISLAYAGLTEDAAAHVTETKSAAGDSANPTTRALAMYAEGECLLDRDPARAVSLLRRAAQTAQASGNEFLAGVCAVSVASLLGRHLDAEQALESFRDIIDRWRRTGNWMQQWTTLRNLADLFVRLEVDESAALLYGAVAENEGAPSVYGPEAARVRDAHGVLQERLGEQRLRDLIHRGSTMSGEQCVALALEGIDRLLERGEMSTLGQRARLVRDTSRTPYPQ
jgi:predicted ATPase